MKDQFYKVEGHSNLVKNPQTGVILNNNDTDIQRARLRKKLKKEQRQKELQLQSEVQSLRDDMDQIKSMLKQLVEKE